LIEFHGAKDDIAVYGGGELKKRECLPSIEHFMHDWAMRNNLGPSTIKTQPKRDTFVYKYGKDLEHGLVTLVVDTAIGHDWPSTTPNLDNTQPGKHPAIFDATRVIMDFFQAHPLFSPMNVIVQRSPASASGSSIIASSLPASVPGGSIATATPTSAPAPVSNTVQTSATGEMNVSTGLIAVLLVGTLALLF